MHLYISQLLEDLRAAHRVEAPFDVANHAPNDDEEGMEAHFAEVERYLSGDHDQRIGDVLNLVAEQFPPVKMLTEAQMQAVVEAFGSLLQTWHIDTDLPQDLPTEKSYELLVSALDKKVYLADDGFVTIEFCSYAPWDCQLGEWCMCKNLGIDAMPETDNGSLPF